LEWWKETYKQTVTMLEIEGPPKLSLSMQMLCGLPGPLGWSFEPAPLIRAINQFRKLGKDMSIAAFREFLEKAPDAGYGHGFDDRPDPENIDTANQWCLSILVPFVFQRSEKDKHRFGSEDVVIQDGIPFHTIVISSTSGWPPNMKPLVDWAEQDGKMEPELLKPTDRPLEAAEKLYDRLFQKLTKEDQESERGRRLKTHLRTQAYSLVRHLVVDETARRRRDTELTDDRWRDLKAKLDGMKIRWNDEKGMYEKTN
jgi:hypothetical protein